MRQLTHIRDGQKVAEYLLDMQDVIIGRGHAAHIRLDDNPVVSRQHALVRSEGKGHVVEDLGGANGTFVDGRKIRRHVLRPGQRIVLGTDTLRYDLGHRTATSLRTVVSPGSAEPDATMETIEELAEINPGVVESLDSFDALSDLGSVNRGRGAAGGGDHTRVADKDELEQMLAKMTIKAKPHLQKLGDDDSPDDPDAGELIALAKSPMRIGHTDECALRLPGKRFFLPGKIAGVLTVEAGRWHLAPESTFWNPVYLNEDKLEKIRMLEPGDVFEARGVRFVYRRGV